MKCKTGIEGFDKLVQGGFEEGSAILVLGSPGTGKSIFCMEFLYNGATKFNEKGLYVTLEQRGYELKKQAKQFGWDFEKLEKEGMVKILSIPVKEITLRTGREIIEQCKKEKIKRLVIDSLSTLAINAPIYTLQGGITVREAIADNVFFSPPVIGDLIVRRFLYNFIDELKSLEKTTKLLIAEASEENLTPENSLAEFLCDGIITLTFESMGGDYSRSLLIKKMRQRKHDEDIHPLEIGKNGMVIHSLDEK